MSNESSAVADAKTRKSPFMPVAIALVAAIGAGVTWMIASPGAVRTGPPQVGDLAPDISLDSTDGGMWKLSEHRGREVLLVFFRTHT